MTQLISKDYLMDHVIDVLVNGTYEEAVLLEDLYDAPVQDEKDGIIRYKLSKPIEYIELVYTDKEVTKLSYDSNVTLVTPKADRPTDWTPLRFKDEYKMTSDFPWELDGSWVIATDGQSVSVERIKKDAYDHFYPNGRYFELEDTIAWMPLPKPYKGGDDE